MNAFATLRQAPQPVAPIVPQYHVDSFTPEGVVVHVYNQDDTTSEFLVDWDANYEGISMAETCTLTVFAEDGKTLSEEEIDTPDWIQVALTHDVEDHLTRLEEDLCCEALCCEADF